MWDIQKTLKGTWRVTTEAHISNPDYDATGEYATREGAITAATMYGEEYVVMRSEQSEQQDAHLLAKASQLLDKARQKKGGGL